MSLPAVGFDTVSMMPNPSTSATEPANLATSIAAGSNVILAEADALRALAGSLDGQFAAIVNAIAAVQGRLIVTGMGKSGHVARKIAATMASTGTPAMFVHPGEASHGDLGMITKADAVMALSNSGETHELRDLILFTRRFGIPLIAMVRDIASTLAQEADYCLAIPNVKEACPMGLAPTTSTTCMLALGDALAVALLEQAGFSAPDFSVFHPGGKLGSQLQRVEDLMQAGEDVPLISSDAAISDVVLEMTRKRLGCVGVVDDAGQLAGIITDGDLRRHMNPDIWQRQARDVMTEDPRTIGRKALVAEAVNEMNARGPRPISVLFVVENGKPVGALHMHDCLRAGVA